MKISCDRRTFARTLLTMACLTLFAATAPAQVLKAPLNQGFTTSSSIRMNVDEMLGPRLTRSAGESIFGPGYPALWIAEMQFKPVRMLQIAVTDPRTNKTQQELVWYMVYRLIRRDYLDLAGDETARENLQRRLDDVDVDPRNKLDPIRSQTLVLPRFVLRTKDNGREQTYKDEINPQIERVIRRREFQRTAKDLVPYNSVHGMRELPPMASADDPSPLQHARYGIAIWRHVDPETDFFEIDMFGMTNAYRITESADGRLNVEDKAIRQRFRRPGDSIDESEREIRQVGEPEWLYLPRSRTVDVPNAISVLSNQRETPETE